MAIITITTATITIIATIDSKETLFDYSLSYYSYS